MPDILEFRDDNRFLSNFYDAEVTFEGSVYPTVEHAYVAAKTESVSIRQLIRNAKTPGEAKRIGRKIELRSGWDVLKLDILEDLVRQKFTNHTELRKKLLATGDVYIMEGNRWGDLFWGIDLKTHEGFNHMGKILMKIRRELVLRERLADQQHAIWSHWMRYMFTCGKLDDGNWVMPKDKVERWKRQMETVYSDLTEKERHSDRDQADKILDCME